MQMNPNVYIPNTQEKTVLYLSDLPSNTIEEDLWVFFEKFNERIMWINIINKSSAYDETKTIRAKVIFKDYESANMARLHMNLRKLKGHAIRLMWDERDNSIRYNTSANWFVKNIPLSVKPREVYEYFIQFGDISSAKLNEDQSGSHKGYGYITYYSQESAEKAIHNSNSNTVWGSRLEVKYFQKKTERVSMDTMNMSRIFLTRFPWNYKENEIVALCRPFGEVVSVNVKIDYSGRKTGIVGYAERDSALKAVNHWDMKVIDGQAISCEIFQEKVIDKSKVSDIKQGNDHNSQFNDVYKDCNLYIKHIPFTVKEEEWTKIFSKYGEIKSCKIETYKLIQKIGKEFKEVVTSKGFGYWCFEKPDSAANARAELNNRFLPGYETWNHALTIELFLSKSQRNWVTAPMIEQPQYFPVIPSMTPYIPVMETSPITNNAFTTSTANWKTPPETVPEKDQVNPIDEHYLNSIENKEDKKEYLGEIIFKLIEEHPIAWEKNLTIDMIGKITGMIINIDDIHEIIDTCKNKPFLTSRINEAINLLNTK